MKRQLESYSAMQAIARGTLENDRQYLKMLIQRRDALDLQRKALNERIYETALQISDMQDFAYEDSGDYYA